MIPRSGGEKYLKNFYWVFIYGSILVQLLYEMLQSKCMYSSNPIYSGLLFYSIYVINNVCNSLTLVVRKIFFSNTYSRQILAKTMAILPSIFY